MRIINVFICHRPLYPSESDNLPAPEVIAQEIVEDLEAALEQFREIVGDLGVPEEVIS